jgi:hypothetical protein
VTPEEQVLLQVVEQLDQLAIPYMVAGSLASSHHGRPRATHDADVVIDPTEASLALLVDRLQAAGLYLDGERARDALRERRQFNVIDPQTAWKVDLIIVKARPFSREELRRRQFLEVIEGVRLALATPEDTILSKLEWAKKAGGSQKQLEDAAGVVDANPDLDRAYLERWARELDVLDLWRQVAAGAAPSTGE